MDSVAVLLRNIGVIVLGDKNVQMLILSHAKFSLLVKVKYFSLYVWSVESKRVVYVVTVACLHY